MSSEQQRLARAEVMVRQLQGALAGHRLVAGVASITGTVFAGTDGWSVSKTATGVYSVTFDPVFAGAPAMVVSAVATVARVARTGTPTTSAVTVVTMDLAGTPADSAFAFVAVGPVVA